jgi:hypothetical protein
MEVGAMGKRALPGALRGLAVTALLWALAPVPAQPAVAVSSDPAEVGRFSEPFEERGSAPRCQRDTDGRIFCDKPPAGAAVALGDGRVLYWDGDDGFERVGTNVFGEFDQIRNGRSRVLDLSGSSAAWTVPVPENGGGSNPDAASDHGLLDTVGLPGRPGEGLVGSTAGRFAGDEPPPAPEDAAENDADLFCSYAVTLPDGRVASFGGMDWYNDPRLIDEYGVGEVGGTRNTAVFDPSGATWQQTTPMKYGRFYPSGVSLGDGRVMAIGGMRRVFKNTQLSQVRRSETMDPASLMWRENYTGPASENSLPMYPRVRLMPNGKVLYYAGGETWGPPGQAVDEALWAVMQSYDPASEQWEPQGVNPLGMRNLPLDVMLPLRPPYEQAVMLVAGGTLGPMTSIQPTTLAQTVTVGPQGRIALDMVGSTHNPRWNSQGVLLPDGTVLAVNGADVDHVAFPGVEGAVREAEIYDPKSRTWRRAATAQRDRVYHHAAVLLADGRVLVGGQIPAPTLFGGYRDVRANNDPDPSFEVYSPPYLFRGPRPEIRDVQAGVAWGEHFAVITDEAEIESVVLIRPMATTHSIDNDQRSVFLDFTQQGDRLTVTAPPNGAVAPPGLYYLFVNRKTAKGPVPSVSRLVKIAAGTDTRPAPPAAYADSTTAVQGVGASPDPNSTARLPGECPWCSDHERPARRRR